MVLTEPHFAARARQRANVTDPNALYQDLRIALADPDRWHEYIEPVRRLNADTTAYRFRIATGIFYAVVKNKNPVTIYTQDQMRSERKRLKHRPGLTKPS